jgi:hypothetical protein
MHLHADANGRGAVTDLATDTSAYITPANKSTDEADVSHFDLVRTTSARIAPGESGRITGSPLTADPLLGPIQDNGGPTETMAPAGGSPAGDAGSAFGLTTDQRGRSRPSDFAAIANRGDGADIGAVELQSPGGGSLAAFGARTLVTLKLAARRIRAKGPLKVRVANANGFAIAGRLAGRTVNRVSISRKRRIKLKVTSFAVAAHARKTIGLKLARPLRRLMKHNGRLKLRLTAKVEDPAGNTRTVTKRVTPKLKPKRRG